MSKRQNNHKGTSKINKTNKSVQVNSNSFDGTKIPTLTDIRPLKATNKEKEKLLDIFLKLFIGNCGITSSPDRFANGMDFFQPKITRVEGQTVTLKQNYGVSLTRDELNLLTKTLFNMEI